ncbi:UNVERIFIED_CONTAM: hypothetical protein GTU68_049797 [Idotea baltica]|nr:hypothetical protein [Idotea baltica]
MLPVFLIAITVTASNFANSTNPDKKKENKQEKTIVGVAASNNNFTTLVAAVKAAGLVDVLNSDGPFTVFAPVNDAFGKLPKGTVPSLLEAKNKEALVNLLKYHVVAGKNNGKFVIKTVMGQNLTAALVDGKVILTDAKGNTSTVIITDVAATNGVIHAIDSVVMPM